MSQGKDTQSQKPIKKKTMKYKTKKIESKCSDISSPALWISTADGKCRNKALN